MRNFYIIIWISFLSVFLDKSLATNYYLSSRGSDNADGRSPGKAWQTIEKINRESVRFKPGDSILFKRGDTFFGTLTILKSGTKEKPIVYTSFGKGENPVITGFSSLVNWVKVGKGVYSIALSCESEPNILALNGLNTPKGRWPDKDSFSMISSHDGNKSITDPKLPQTPDFTGGEIVFKPYPWVINHFKIVEHKSHTLYYNGTGDEPRDGMGYFIQNHISTLDKTGEWCFDKGTLYIYFGEVNPGDFTVRASLLDYLVVVNGISSIVFTSLSFEGANVAAFNLTRVKNLTIDHNSMNFMGVNAIMTNYGGQSDFLMIRNNVVKNCNNSFTKILEEFQNVTISGNDIEDSGMLIGMGSVSTVGAYCGITCDAPDCTIENNRVINTGCNGIVLTSKSSNAKIRNNFVKNFCVLEDDGGGIYSWVGSKGKPASGQEITGNIVIGGTGSSELGEKIAAVNGIYLDDGSQNLLVSGNSVANCSRAGIFIHNSHDLIIEYNTVFNCSMKGQINFVQDQHAPDDKIRNIKLNHNIFVAGDADQPTLLYETTGNDIADFGSADYNCYARPADESETISTHINAWKGSLVNRSLEDWKKYSGQDKNSYGSFVVFAVARHNIWTRSFNKFVKIFKMSITKPVDNLENIRFEYNETDADRRVKLDDSYTDVKGNRYNGHMILKPHSSAILMKTGTR